MGRAARETAFGERRLRTRKTRPVAVDRIPMLLNAPVALTLGLSHASLAPPPCARPVSRRGRAQAEEHLRGDGADAFDELGADAAPPGALGSESEHYRLARVVEETERALIESQARRA